MTARQGTTHIGKKKIGYTIRRGASEKYIRMGFTDDLELEIILPRRDKVDIHDLLKKKKGWIEKRYKELSRSKRIYNDNKVLYKGKYRSIEIARRENSHVKSNRSGIEIMVNHVDPMDVLEAWMHRQTMIYVKDKVQEYAEKIDVTYNRIFVRVMNKWGSCSQRGNLTFNSHLVALPEKLADYVVAHEVMHLKEFNHNMRFKHGLEKHCPHSEQKRKQLHVYLPT